MFTRKDNPRNHRLKWPKEIELDEKVFNSPLFRELFQRQVEADTWGKGLPKCYMDDEGWLVHHWKDGKIDKIKKIK